MPIITDARQVAAIRADAARLKTLSPIPWELINAMLDNIGDARQGPEEEEKRKTPPKPPPPPPPPPPKPPEKPPAPPPRPPAPAPPPPGRPAPAPPPKGPVVKPQLIIERTAYPKWWKDEGTAPINLASPGFQFVVSARSDYTLYIGAIVLTVSGECILTFGFGVHGSSGPMKFGGSDEPRGIVIAMGNSPAPCGSASFTITASSEEAVSIGGFVTYFLWKK